MFQIVLNSLGNLGDEQLRIAGKSTGKLAASSIPVLLESILLQKKTAEFDPEETYKTKLIATIKAFMFSLTLEISANVIFLKLENLAKILMTSEGRIDLIPAADLVVIYKILLQVMSKARLKIYPNDVSPRVALSDSG